MDIEKMVAKKVREQMFTKLLAKELEKGTGKFDADQVATLIVDLGLEEAKGKVSVWTYGSDSLHSSHAVACENACGLCLVACDDGLSLVTCD